MLDDGISMTCDECENSEKEERGNKVDDGPRLG